MDALTAVLIPKTAFVADQLADLMMSGATGMQLVALLREHLSHATRDDVFLGIGLAMSLIEADRVGLIHDLTVAENRLAVLEGASGG